MNAILYPVAASAEAAFSRPVGRAARASDAKRAAGAEVVFATDPMGPAFATREAALDAYAGRVEDDRTGGSLAPEERYCQIAAHMDAARPPAPVLPTYADGRRWPQPPGAAPRAIWRLQVSYWRIGAAERPLEPPQAREARRARQPLDPEQVRAIARQPLRPVKPQQPLDIGLFEVRPPEAPHIIMPDE